MKIIIKANCSPDDAKKYFDGLSDDSCFSEYFGFNTKIPKCVTGGFMHFEFHENPDTLYVFTIYDSTRKITADEEKELIKYTQGQWSDGIGEGFEQRDFDDEIYNPSPWYPGQKIELSYL